MTFQEEYPRLTELGRGIGRCLIGIAAAVAATGLAQAIGAQPYVAGWFACYAFLTTWRY